MIINFITQCFPRICHSCSKKLLTTENVICLDCFYITTPKNIQVKSLQSLFWGRCKLKNVFTLFYYLQGSPCSQLIQDLKYNGIKLNAKFFGKHLGDLINEKYPAQFDFIIPIPLHPKKLKKRGYNQSLLIANETSKKSNIPILNALNRRQYNQTQTNQDKFNRWSNSEEIFEPVIKIPENAHVLIIDDVITTGSTIEQAYLTLLKNASVKISVAACAFTPLDHIILNQ